MSEDALFQYKPNQSYAMPQRKEQKKQQPSKALIVTHPALPPHDIHGVHIIQYHYYYHHSQPDPEPDAFFGDSS